MMTDDELYRFFYPDKLKLALQRLSCGKNTVRSVKKKVQKPAPILRLPEVIKGIRSVKITLAI